MKIFLAIGLALLSTEALAQDLAGPYVGFGLGVLDYEEKDFGVILEDKTMAYKVYGGYRFDERWTIEGSYGQTASLEWSEFADIPGFGFVSATLKGDYDVIEIRGLAHFDWFLVGLGYWDADLSATLSGNTSFAGPFDVWASDSDSGTSLIVGGEWHRDKLVIRSELDYFDTDSAIDVYTFGVGLHFRF
jgi:hypothetical protein